MRSTGPASDPPQIGRYQVIRHLATGGMAQIYLARMGGMADFERHVVLKTILANRANDRRFINMFLDEAKLAATLNHQNIAQVYEIDQADGAYYMAMEYVHGENCRAILENSIRKGVQIPLECALLIVSSAAAGLHHAHERKGKTGQALNIVHRDVSPANIMVGYDGSVKVLDFGIAKAEERYTQTVGSTIKGKYGYMSPEQCKGKAIDRRSDIFALGIVLYELTTQRRAFKGRDDFDTMKRIVASDLVLPSALVPGYPLELETIILKTLAPEPDNRYATAQDLIEALDAFTQRAKLTCTNTAMARFMVQLFGEPREPWETAQVDGQRPGSSSPDAAATSVGDNPGFDADEMPTMLSASTPAPRAPSGRAHAPTAPAVLRARTPSVAGGRVQTPTAPPAVPSAALPRARALTGPVPAPASAGHSGAVPLPVPPPPGASSGSVSRPGAPARRQGATTPPPMHMAPAAARRPLAPSIPPAAGADPAAPETARAPSGVSAPARAVPSELLSGLSPAAQPTPLQVPTARAATPLSTARAAPMVPAPPLPSGPLSVPLAPPRALSPAVPGNLPPLPAALTPPLTSIPAVARPSAVMGEAVPLDDGGPRAQSSVMAPLPRSETLSSGAMMALSGSTLQPLQAVELPPPPPERMRYRWVIYLVLVSVVAAVGLMIALTLSSKPS